MWKENFIFQFQKTRYHTLTSLCLISHHPFFMAFRECLFYLKSLIDVCNDSVTRGPGRHRKRLVRARAFAHVLIRRCLRADWRNGVTQRYAVARYGTTPFTNFTFYLRRASSIWDVIIQRSNSETPLIRHYIKEIEKWILRLLSAPVPVPGKTRVEVDELKWLFVRTFLKCW